jgi:hypothetical protein
MKRRRKTKERRRRKTRERRRKREEDIPGFFCHGNAHATLGAEMTGTCR